MRGFFTISEQPARPTADSGSVMHILVVVLLALVGACASGVRPPNFGTLERDARPFSFAPNLELVDVTNGLRIVLVREERTNLATIDVRYTVGAAEDPAGRAGLAHLVEHLMFELRKEPGAPTVGEELGELALYSNAATSWDYTHFTTHVPIEHLERALALEARRMRASCDELDEATFLREREVVRAEGRQRASAFDDSMRGLLKEVYGEDHPYTRAITSDEIATVTRDEACAFLARHYTPDRAYLVVTGPFEVARVKALLTRTFGRLDHKATAARAAIAPARLDGRLVRRAAPVSRPTALVFLPFPAWGADGVVKFQFAHAALARELARADGEHAWIRNTGVYLAGGERARVLVAAIEVERPEDLDRVSTEVFARTDRLLDALTAAELGDELGRMTMRYVETWDDVGARGWWLSHFLQFTAHDQLMIPEMRALLDTPWAVAIAQLRGFFTPDRSHVVLLTPQKGATPARPTPLPSESHALTPWRAPVDAAEAHRPLTLDDDASAPRIDTYTLANGLRVQLAPDPHSPIVDARVVFPVGRAHEPTDRPYLATAAARLLFPFAHDRYTAATHTKLGWSMSRGTELATTVGETSTVFSARGLAMWGDWHVWYLAHLLDHGSYSEAVLNAARSAVRDRGDDDAVEVSMTDVFLARVFGAEHPYGRPAPDRNAAFLQLDAAELTRWRDAHYRVNGATLIVSGAFDVVAMKREIDELFAPLAATAAAARPDIPRIAPAKGPAWLALEDAEALQTRITIGFPMSLPPGDADAPYAVLGEMIEDALREVREGMGASYGFDVAQLGGAAGGVLVLTGEVDAEKADEVLAVVLRGLDSLRTGAEDHRAAFVRARRKVLARTLGRAGGATAIADALTAKARGGQRPLAAARVAALTFADVARVAATDLADTHRVVLVAGTKRSLAATFATIAVTPERRVRPRDGGRRDPAHDGAEDEPAAAAQRAVPDGRPHRDPEGPRLSVGAPEGELASMELGLFLGSRRLTLDEFLDVAGATEVKARMRRRSRTRTAAFVAAAVGVTAAAIMRFGRESCDDSAEPFTCEDDLRTRTTRAFTVLSLSVGVGAWGLVIDSGEPTTSELRAIAARYNRAF